MDKPLIGPLGVIAYPARYRHVFSLPEKISPLDSQSLSTRQKA